MPNFNRLTIWTIALSFFIPIDGGWAVYCVGLFEIGGISGIFKIGISNILKFGIEYFSLSLTASYNKSLFTVALFALLGQIILVISIFVKGSRQVLWIKTLGLLFLWMSFYYLTHNISYNDPSSQFSFVAGLPFLIVSLILTYKLFRQKTQLAHS